MKLSSLVTGLFGLAALTAVAASPAQAAFVVGGENGWQMSFDGMINVFAVYDAKSTAKFKDGTPAGDSAEQSFRVRTGLLPSIFAFNVKSPTINGVDYGARIGIYPQIENAASHTGLGPNSTIPRGTSVDFREIFLTADSCYGQLLAGRALNLYQGKNILTDMTLIGVGVPQNLTGLGVSLGFIGAGYTYASFGPQFRYTTPDMKGFKWALEIADPSGIGGTADDMNQRVNQPRFETELSYVMPIANGSVSTWLAGIYQEAKFKDNNHKVISLGGSGGVQAGFGPVGAVLSGWGGKGIGMTLTQDDGNALDGNDKERTAFGGLAQLTYTVGKAKIGAQYGINYQDRTDFDKATGFGGLKSNQAVTGGVYYSVNKYMTVVGEYTYTIAHQYNSVRQHQNIGALGTVFVW